MIYLLLLPITLIFGTTFFMLGRFSRRPTTDLRLPKKVRHFPSALSYSINEPVTSEPKFMFFKDGKRVFPSESNLQDMIHQCDVILHVVKCRWKLTDIMVVFKSRFNIVGGSPKVSA
jgi:hypothetical protein